MIPIEGTETKDLSQRGTGKTISLKTMALWPLLVIALTLTVFNSAEAGTICGVSADGTNTASSGSTATSGQDFACGDRATATSPNSGLPAVAVGVFSTASGVAATAIGAGAGAIGDETTATGFQSFAAGTGSTAYGVAAYAGAASTVSSNFTAPAFSNNLTTAIGDRAQAGIGAAGQDRATAIGQGAQANGLSATAVGQGSAANATGATALGQAAQASGTLSVAIGQSSNASAANAVALGAGSVANVANTVSVGAVGSERRIVNVAAGTVASGSTDAVNGGQLLTANQRVAAAFGGSAGLDANGQLTAPSYQILGNTYNNVGGALGALNAAVSLVQGSSTYYQANSTGPAASASGTDALAMGPSATASGNNSIAVGSNAQASGSSAIAIGNAANAVAANSVAIGQGSVATASNTVSFGAPGNERRLTNVAAGSSATDAVNVGQLQSATSGFQSQIAGLQTQIGENQREARRGIVAAVSVAPVMMPSAPGKTTVAVNTGYYRGETGVGVGVSHRLDLNVPTVVYGSYSNGGGNEHIGRTGIAVEF